MAMFDMGIGSKCRYLVNKRSFFLFIRCHVLRHTFRTLSKFGMDFLMANVGIQTSIWQSNSYNFDKYYQPSRDWINWTARVCHQHTLSKSHTV